MALPGEASTITATIPIVDGDIIPDIPVKLARQGVAKNIVTVIGTNLDEWQLFGLMQPGFGQIDENGVLKRLELFVAAEDAKKLMAAYKKVRENRGEIATPTAVLSAIQTDYMFRIPALELVEAQRDNNQKTYNYIFTWKSPVMGGVLGACHALEVGFVFGKHDATFCGTGPEADKLAECIQDAWIAFSRTGDPSCKSTGKWPVYGSKRITMMLQKNCYVDSAPYEEERQAWEKVERKTVML